MTNWTDQNTIETAWATTNRGVRVMTDFNADIVYNQPELDYAGYYLNTETRYTQADDVETAWAE